MKIKLTEYHDLIIQDVSLCFKSGAWTVAYTIYDNFSKEESPKLCLAFDKIYEPWLQTAQSAIDKLVEYLKK